MLIRSYVNKQIKLLEKPFIAQNNVAISRSAILNNFDVFRRLSPGEMVIPVLKANAYGHGIEQVAEILKDRKMPYLAVDGYFEALKVREVSSQPVLVMGAIAPDNFQHMTFRNTAFVVGDIATVRALGKTGRRVPIHVEIDTGMARYGVPMEELEEFLMTLKRYPKLELEGVMSHLADADNPSDSSYDDRQTERFDRAVEVVRAAGFAPKYRHLAQSAGSVKVRSNHANALRVGIALYGVSPFEVGDPARKVLAELRPALALTSTITQIHRLKAGETVSYGRTFTAVRASRIGVLPLGFYEGLPRTLSNVGIVGVGSKHVPIVGRICMNHTMIDLTDSKAEAGDRVTVISAEGGDQVSLQAICDRHKLFNYAFLVGLNGNIRRSIVV